jgi:hypothetical protein
MHTTLEIEFPSATSSTTYTIKRARNGADWYCDCPSWKFQHAAPSQRTCKHIKALATSLGDYIERASA